MFFTYFTVLQCGVKKLGGEPGVQQCHVSSQMKARHPHTCHSKEDRDAPSGTKPSPEPAPPQTQESDAQKTHLSVLPRNSASHLCWNQSQAPSHGGRREGGRGRLLQCRDSAERESVGGSRILRFPVTHTFLTWEMSYSSLITKLSEGHI